MKLTETQWNLLKAAIKRLVPIDKVAAECFASLGPNNPKPLSRRSQRFLENYCDYTIESLKRSVIPEYQRRIEIENLTNKVYANELQAYQKRAIDKLLEFEYIIGEVRRGLKK